MVTPALPTNIFGDKITKSHQSPGLCLQKHKQPLSNRGTLHGSHLQPHCHCLSQFCWFLFVCLFPSLIMPVSLFPLPPVLPPVLNHKSCLHISTAFDHHTSTQTINSDGLCHHFNTQQTGCCVCQWEGFTLQQTSRQPAPPTTCSFEPFQLQQIGQS